MVDGTAQGTVPLTSNAMTTNATTWGGCQQGSDVTLWRLNNGPHIPALSADFPTLVIDYLFQFDKTP